MLSRITIFILIGLPVLLHAQKNVPEQSNYISQPNRLEFDIQNSDVEFTVIGGEENGLLVVVETYDRVGDGYKWILNVDEIDHGPF